MTVFIENLQDYYGCSVKNASDFFYKEFNTYNDGQYNWAVLISDEMKEHGETWNDVVDTTLSIKEMKDPYYRTDYSPLPWTLWTENRVYFAEGYDSNISVRSVPRNVTDEKTNYVGGGCE